MTFEQAVKHYAGQPGIVILPTRKYMEPFGEEMGVFRIEHGAPCVGTGGPRWCLNNDGGSPNASLGSYTSIGLITLIRLDTPARKVVGWKYVGYRQLGVHPEDHYLNQDVAEPINSPCHFEISRPSVANYHIVHPIYEGEQS